MRIYLIKEKKNLQVIVRVELYKRKNKLLKYIAENLIYFLQAIAICTYIFISAGRVIRYLIGPNFIGPNFRYHLKISSIRADKVWTDKVYT